MTPLTLERIRTLGMRALCAWSALLGLSCLVGAFVTGASGHYGAALLAIALIVYPCMLVSRGSIDSAARIAMAITATAQPVLMLYVFAGQAWQTDLHMIFFAGLAMSVLLCDWRAIAAAAAVVAVHHLAFGMLVPAWVFEGDASFGRILFHAVILVAEAATLMWLTHRIVLLLDTIVATERERHEVERAASADRARQSEELGVVVGALGESLKSLAQGDLSAEITHEFPPAYAEVRAHFNEATTSLRGLIGSVIESATAIQTGSGEIAQASEDLARRTEGNAASLEETSAAITQIDQRLKVSATAASQTVERADGAIATVSGGRSIADEAVQAMGRVSESAKGIDSVIEGLDKIAFQTRVLAMNAAVEAGRAGEAGRGFAVVADLVSALAMRAEEEAGRARDQLTATQTDIVAAVQMVEKVDGALANISGDVGEVHSLLGQMAADNQAQSTAISQISVAIGTMDHATQQNAAMVEQTSAAARNLSSEVTSLADQAARFKIGNEQRKPAPRQAPRQTKPNAYVSPVKALPAAAMATGGDAGDWTSF
ncbi:methyl-accepting chemotaxis protein [Sphingomonas sp. dw_22]|uniref:methyl-accepting chemotaxis protein n=1 Tax=Sphingomonas sp. dw_22 TaxID=2721175 RepID=UPI001BD5D989|nr:methyl-accepting chemotaxis protein [Sphingomonas sp. dw_22]